MIEVLAITPFERPDVALVRALHAGSALAVLDLGRDLRRGRSALAELGALAQAVRVPEGTPWTAADLPDSVTTVILPVDAAVAAWGDRRVLVEVRSAEEALLAAAAGAAGVVARGSESGGRVGRENAFVLCQHLAAAALTVPFYVGGGVGVHTAAACAVGGAAGVVLDAQLALAMESSLPEPIRRAVRAMDGSETTVVAGFRVYTRPDLGVASHPPTEASEVLSRLGADDLRRNLVPMGQDAALAAGLAHTWRTAGAIVRAVADAALEHVQAAAVADPLGPDSALARDHGTPYPLLQGPMTRVSDVAPFAAAVAQGGGLPFIALSMLRGGASRRLLEATAEALGTLPWGVGILGFVPPELRDPQIEAIAAVKPPFALIAGGRPSQARALEDAGTPTYLHAPSPALLDAFLKDGARRFVFEGSECGGHVGPRSSFVLWEQAVQRLMAFAAPAEVSAVFAGGIHDARSAAMVAAMVGPLAARGTRIGALMGTAYLFTAEAVSTGAIKPGFQQAAVQARVTALVETAPGHATRCVDSAFVNAFETERKRLEADGVDPKAKWAALEQLNLGRLRIAAKGVVRQGDDLLEVDEATQAAEGMFMIGQVAALRHEVTTIADLHREVSEGARDLLAPFAPQPEVVAADAGPADVAIVGMACVFPDAPDLDTFWRNILAGHDAVREIPPERWRSDLYYDAHGVPGETTPSKWGGLLPEIRFDPLRFGIPPRSLGAIDPAQLLALEVARRALEDAGLDRRPFDRDRTSVIFGTESGSDLGGAYSFRAQYRQFVGEMSPELDAALPRLSEDSFPGVLANVLAGRIANRLDLGGVNYTVDAACASSLAALDLAVKELVGGTSDVVLCGGADLHNGINDYLLFSSVHALSPTGRCRTFDASADGIVLGEGVACVVLKRLVDAQRDGDRVYAVIRGVGGSSDGRSLGLTAPRKEGQKRAVERAWSRAGIPTAAVGMVEAHGTGTVVGDRTEMRTLEESFVSADNPVAPGSVTLGSVKSQIGHTKCAAGLAGLIKASLAIHHGVRPPTSQLHKPNDAWREDVSPFHFVSTPQPWPSARRVAGVSAFGFGGTNFHAVLEGPNAWPAPPSVRNAELFVLRGDDARVTRVLDSLVARLDDDEPASLAALAKATCFVGDGPVNVAIVARDHAELRAAIGLARARQSVEGSVFVRDATAAPVGQVAFLFPGQGSQRVGMLRELFVAVPELQRFLQLAPDLVSAIFPPEAFDDASRKAQQAAITDTRVAQPALGIVDLAVAAFLESCGVSAAMAAGHSYGELAALAWAGAMDADTLAALSRARAGCILDAAPADPGAMAAVRATPAQVQAAVGDAAVVVANHNAPRQTVIAGPTAAVDAAVVVLEAAGLTARRIPVACAFHSPVVAAAATTFAARLADAALSVPSVPVWSNTEATAHPADADGIRALLARQVAEPVRWVDQIEAMYAAGARTFVEVGPGRVLTGLVDKILGNRPHLCVPFDVAGDPGWVRHLGALATLATHGVGVDVAALFAGREIDDIELSRAPKAAGTWLVDGMRARPVTGDPPKGSLIPILEPLGHVTVVGTPTISDDRDVAVTQFLQNMAAIAEAQRDVVLGLLGQSPEPRAIVARPRDIVTAVQVPAAVAAVVPVPSAAPARPADLLATLLEVVSDRTGYPPEMLDPDLDLEADLSIDSIKRIEILNALGEQLGLADAGMDDEAIEALATRKSLRDIVGWLEERGMGTAVVDAVAAVPVQIDMLAVLLEVVSDRTGYPPEMLDPDLDLEADLSIDSIKRIEILNALGERMGTDAARMDDDAIEALAARKTLREIVSWLDAPTAAAVTAAAVIPQLALPPSTVRRYRLVAHALPIPILPGDIRSFSVVDGDSLRAARIGKALRKRGFSAEVVPAAQAASHDTVIHVDGAGPVAVFPELTALLEGGVRTVVGVDAGATGLEGLFRTAAREYPDRTVRLVSLDDPGNVDSILDLVPHELAEVGGPSHVRYRGTARETLVVEPAPFDAAEVALPLTPDSVVLITGGARGITARIAQALAAEVPCTYVLVGRSPLPAEQDDPVLAAAPDASSLRRALVAAGLKKPAEIEAATRRILRDREMRANLDTIAASGATVDYRAVDVRDAAAFRTLVADLYATYGRLDGVVHGAGVLDDKLMRDKSAESFARVYETKVAAAQVLSEVLLPATRFVVFFGSISGVLGNRGQSDYAAANATLDALASTLGDRIEGRVVSIDWGPWGGAGMVSDALASEYARRGIALIPVEEGVSAFLDELRRGGRGDRQVIWQAGDPLAFGGHVVER